MSDEDLHRRRCEEGDGWSHAFRVEYDDDGNLTAIRQAGFGRIGFVFGRIDFVQFFREENWREMGDAISQSATLEEISINSFYSESKLNEEGMEALFGGDRVYRCSSLRRVNLGSNQFGPGGMEALLPFLKSTSTLYCLCLSGVSTLGERGARLLADALNFVRIESLNLHATNIGDVGVEHILQAENSRHISKLVVGRNGIGRRGLGAISHILRTENISLTKTYLSGNAINSECANMLLRAVMEKPKLEVLQLWGHNEVDDGTVLSIVPQLQELVCNTSSFDALCRSNHKLRDIGPVTEKILKSSPNLKKAFDINARSKSGASVTKRVRCKLRTFFFQGEFDMQPFSDIDVQLMPHVLELVTRTEVCTREVETVLAVWNEDSLGDEDTLEDRLGTGKYYEVENDSLDGTYCLIRNCHLPELFGFPSLEADNARLRERVAELQAEIKELRTAIAALPNKLPKTGN